MQVTMQDQAIQRAIKILENEAYDRVADVIADLIHYCESIERFNDELETAITYVHEEQGYDAELLAD